MSTARRRPTGAPTSRRPQVAGRPRSAAGASGTESEDTAEGGLAVDERTDARSTRTVPAPTETSDMPDSPRSRTVSRPGTRTDEDAPAAAPDPEPDTGTELPAAPAVRSGETSDSADESEEDGPGGSGLASRVRRIGLPQAPVTRRATAALLAVTILLVAAAGFFAVSWARLQFSGATSNTALSDVGATATVSEQVDEAVTKVYSFDFARLDQAESDARGVITGGFTGQFDQIFGNVRQLAPKQQAVVTATVPKSAVQSIDGNTATMYVFVNQVIRRVDDGGQAQQGTAAARLKVDAQFVDGRWKISGMNPA